MFQPFSGCVLWWKSVWWLLFAFHVLVKQFTQKICSSSTLPELKVYIHSLDCTKHLQDIPHNLNHECYDFVIKDELFIHVLTWKLSLSTWNKPCFKLFFRQSWSCSTVIHWAASTPSQKRRDIPSVDDSGCFVSKRLTNDLCHSVSTLSDSLVFILIHRMRRWQAVSTNWNWHAFVFMCLHTWGLGHFISLS